MDFKGLSDIDINQYNTYRDFLFELQKKWEKSSDYFITPDVITKVFVKLARKLGAMDVLVPFFGTGKITNSLISEGLKVDSICKEGLELEIAKKFGYSLFQYNDRNKYKLICCEFVGEGLKKQIEELKQMLNQTSNHLIEEGVYAFVFPSTIKSNRIYKSFFELAQDLGLYVNAVISMPEKAYEPYVFVGTRLLLLSKRKNFEHFVAEISEDQDIEIVLSNFLNHVKAKKYSLGAWVNDDEYFDLHDFEVVINIPKIAKKFNGRPWKITDLAKEINRPSNDGVFEENADAIYIPLIGLSDVVDNIDSFKISAQHYVQVVVDTNIVSTQYMCFYLNGLYGIESRKNQMVGAMVSRLYIESLKEIIIMVPSIDEQNSMLNTQKNIQELKAQIDSLESAFLKLPSNYKDIEKNIKNINNYESIEEWAEKLPFPLASVLRRYFAETTFGKKQEALLLFFEAYAIFNACIMLSILNESIGLIDKDDALKGTDISFYNYSSFGTWALLNKIITNYSRTIVKKSEEEGSLGNNTLRTFFKTTNLSLINVLCNPKINKILSDVAYKRNVWKGHVGITSDKICKPHVIELEGKLAELRGLVTDAFDDIELLKSKGMHYENGQFESNIELLRGSNSIFMKDSFKSSIPLDEAKLYILMKDTELVVQLIPLIIFKKSPDNVENACYFYSRDDKKNDLTYYVSYHYDSEPESELGHSALDAITKIVPAKTEQ